MTIVESPYHALISYSHLDATIVKKLHKRLVDAGFAIWIDEGDIWPAADWWDQIQQGMRSADNVLFMISPSSLASVVCHQELDYARSLGKRVIPVMLNKGDDYEATLRDALVSIVQEDLDEAAIARIQGREIAGIFRKNVDLLNRHDWIYCLSEAQLEEAANEAIRCIQVDEHHHRMLTNCMQQALTWQNNERSPDRILKGEEISEAESWLQQAISRNLDVPELVKEFIRESRNEDIALQQHLQEIKNREKQLMRSRQRNFRIAMSFGIVLVIIAVFVAFNRMRLIQLQQLAAQVEMASFPDSTVWLGEDRELIESLMDRTIGFDIQPRQQVEVAAFQIDLLEVSFANYALCIEAGVCSQTSHEMDDPDPNLPVVGVDAFQSAQYCQWLGKRLPTRAEWERVARGADYRQYPWEDDAIGDDIPAHMFTGIEDFSTEPMSVDVNSSSFADGATPEGVMHLLGNVAEWTSTPVCSDPYHCPMWDGISDVDQLYTLGFSYADDYFDEVTHLGVATRTHPGQSDQFIGFRCAQSGA
ncbi:SUMF1/EgtB/PvdO family nonheme iron enzyme [Candidatus Saccharibacteria bacterium]|nr:SUMF1/EgtB/PvdO family nonheme iron enzyme [Candidatus Saccharibacteria bacterium]